MVDQIPVPRSSSASSTITAVAAAGLLLISTPAVRAHDLCGTIKVLGKPLPEGFATLAGDDRAWNGRAAKPGPSERSFVRFKDGRFCFGAPAPGNYVVWISPLGLWEPMAAVFSGLGGGPESRRMTVSEDGRVGIYDSSGTLRSRELALSYAQPPAGPDWARLSVSLDFSSGKELPGQAVLTMLHLQFLGYSFAWVDPAAPSPSIELEVMPWKLVDAIARAPGWAIASTEPPFHELYGDSTSFKPAQTKPFKLRLAPAAEVRGQVTDADGRPFRPYLGVDKSKRAVFGFFVSNLAGSIEFHAYVDEDGRFRFEAPEGLWQLQPLFERADGYSIRMGRQILTWLKPGSIKTMDYQIPARARFKVDHSSVPLGTFWEQEFSLYPRRDHWVLAFPAGPLDPAETFALLDREEAVFAVAQRPNGRWRISEGGPDAGEDERLTVAAGDYDVYLVESDHVAPPSARVLAVKGARITPDGSYELGFSATEMYPAGHAELVGSVASAMKLTWKDIEEAGSMRRFQLALAPHVNVYDEKGRLRGTAFADIGQAQFAAVARALADHDLEAVRKALYAGPRPYKIGGLAPGRYRAQAVAFGYPARERRFDLKDGEGARWDVSFDKNE